MQKIVLLLVIQLVWLVPALAQDARDILSKTASSYREVEQYHLEATIDVKMEAGGQEQGMKIELLLAEKKPEQQIRAEMKSPDVEMTIVSNGENTWLYIPPLNQFMKQEGAFNPQVAGAMVPDIFDEYVNLADSVVSAHLQGEETLTMAGDERKVFVLDVVYQPKETPAGTDSTQKTLWIDQDRFIVLKEITRAYVSESPAGMPMHIEESTLFSRVQIGEPVEDSLFAFTPPEGVTEIYPEDVFSGPEGNLTEKAATNFSLQNLDGETVYLESFRGKVVLLNFWATWCGPCLVELPAIEQLYKEFADKGLVVLAVDVAEAREDVLVFVEENRYTFPVLLDEDGSTANLYGAAGIPTSVIIDREGNISHHFVGARPEQMFRKALKEVGLD